jgi:Coenzyme PQQ synthesis protein D (PqqD)
MEAQPRFAEWRLWRPMRRYFLWRYSSFEPPCAEIILPEKTLELNAVGTFLWESLDGTRLAAHLVELLEERYPEVPLARLSGDVLAFLLFCHGEQIAYLDWEPLQ